MMSSITKFTHKHHQLAYMWRDIGDRDNRSRNRRDSYRRTKNRRRRWWWWWPRL
jgi:hypothetical protein